MFFNFNTQAGKVVHVKQTIKKKAIARNNKKNQNDIVAAAAEVTLCGPVPSDIQSSHTCSTS